MFFFSETPTKTSIVLTNKPYGGAVFVQTDFFRKQFTELPITLLMRGTKKGLS